MAVCIDTNVLIQASKAGHPLSLIFYGWFQRRFIWALSNDILAEYEEVITHQSGRQRWLQLSRVLDLAAMRGDLLIEVRPTFRFQVIASDPDDNKFTDCAITAEADYIITEDGDFADLVNSGYKPRAITPHEFISIHLSGI